jgi:hypothetical protein
MKESPKLFGFCVQRVGTFCFSGVLLLIDEMKPINTCHCTHPINNLGQIFTSQILKQIQLN